MGPYLGAIAAGVKRVLRQSRPARADKATAFVYRAEMAKIVKTIEPEETAAERWRRENAVALAAMDARFLASYEDMRALSAVPFPDFGDPEETP